jgi:hypothetical protein
VNPTYRVNSSRFPDRSPETDSKLEKRPLTKSLPVSQWLSQLLHLSCPASRRSMANDSKEQSASQPNAARSTEADLPRAAGDVRCLYQGWDERRVGEETGTAFLELHASFMRRAGAVPDSVNALVRAREKLIEGKARGRAAKHVEISDDVGACASDFAAVIDAKRCLRIVAEVADERQRELLELLARGATAEDWEAYERASRVAPNARHFRVHALHKYLRDALTRRGMGDVLDALCA